jgi:hypothetical protein
MRKPLPPRKPARSRPARAARRWRKAPCCRTPYWSRGRHLTDDLAQLHDHVFERDAERVLAGSSRGFDRQVAAGDRVRDFGRRLQIRDHVLERNGERVLVGLRLDLYRQIATGDRVGHAGRGLVEEPFPSVGPFDGEACSLFLVHDGYDQQIEHAAPHVDRRGVRPRQRGQHVSLVCWIFVEDVDVAADQRRHAESRQFSLELVLGLLQQLGERLIQIGDVEFLVRHHDVCAKRVERGGLRGAFHFEKVSEHISTHSVSRCAAM